VPTQCRRRFSGDPCPHGGAAPRAHPAARRRRLSSNPRTHGGTAPRTRSAIGREKEPLGDPSEALSSCREEWIGPSRVSDREARADGQGDQLIDRISPGPPVRKLLAGEELADWHARVPLTGCRPDDSGRVELAAIDAHRAAEMAADLEGRLDDRVARQAWRNT
jgi:hypothetical protein